MKIALFGKSYAEEQIPFLQMLIDKLAAQKADIRFYKPYLDKITRTLKLPSNIGYFSSHEELASDTDMLFSVGGDGTLFDTIQFVRGSGIPILVINILYPPPNWNHLQYHQYNHLNHPQEFLFF